MAKKQKEMPKEQIITLFDKDYKESELSEEQNIQQNLILILLRNT